MLPLIGLTTYGRNAADQFYLDANYAEAVRQAGGVPILLPPGEARPEDLLQRLDGIVFTGGGDISPEFSQGNDHDLIYGVNLERDQFELQLAKLALTADVAVLGICRGLQVLSLASDGGPLIPHLPEIFTQFPHRIEPSTVQARAQPTRHEVTVSANSRLANAVNCDRFPVVSWHHQAIKTVPPGWRQVAQAPDGLIEAIEHQHSPWQLALQWHPEMSIDDGYQLKIFQAFIAAAANRI